MTTFNRNINSIRKAARDRQLVKYCPGSAVGSPAWMKRSEAEELLARDSYYIETILKHEENVVYPHIDGKCIKCK